VPTDHTKGYYAWNKGEIEEAIAQAREYPDIVKIIAVGNEAMVDWQAHYVSSSVILKWVNRLREARDNGEMPGNVLITSSDNWAAWGGEPKYHNDDLLALIRAVDFVSLHTYAYHDTFYDANMKWNISADEPGLTAVEQSTKAIANAMKQEVKHYNLVKEYISDNRIKKQIHIGETGWATVDNAQYGDDGTCASDEYKSKLFHDAMRVWTEENNLTCFYFEAFDEPWKSGGTDGSEGHFGLFTVDGRAKYSIWDHVEAGAFEGLSRGGRPITKTYGGVESALLKKVKAPARK
jgi:exo-beta-1,3-glucanase (GH17 family)